MRYAITKVEDLRDIVDCARCRACIRYVHLHCYMQPLLLDCRPLHPTLGPALVALLMLRPVVLGSGSRPCAARMTECRSSWPATGCIHCCSRPSKRAM